MSENPAVAQLIVQLEQASAGNRELDAAIALHIEQKQWPGADVRELDDGDDDNQRSGGSRRECLIREGGTDDWAIVHGGDWGATLPVPAYTTSLDAALLLVPEGCHFAVATDPNGGAIAAVDADGSYIGDTLYYPGASGGETPALALCIAALKARQSQGG